MGLALQRVEFPDLIPVTQAAESSLTFLVQDLQARRTDGASVDIEGWINALQRQGRPLVASSQGRANLKAWLALVEDQA